MDESTKSGVRTRKRNKSIKDKAKLVSLIVKKHLTWLKICIIFYYLGVGKYSSDSNSCDGNPKAHFKRQPRLHS